MSLVFNEFSNNKEENYFSFFKLLSESEIELIKQKSNIVSYQKGNNIFLQQTRTSHIMYIKSGLVKIYKEGRMGKK